jgi:Putative transposase
LGPILSSRRRDSKSKFRADTGAVTLIQRFGSAANLNIHLHCLVLDGVYLNRGGVPVFQRGGGSF